MTDINESIKKFGYTPEDFFTTMNNYLSAIYAIKQATSSIKESIETKVKTYNTQNDNSKDFLKILSLYSDYVNKLKSLYLTIKPLE